MSAINDGGPAFPFDERNGDGTHYHSHAGMSLRDYFAAKALASLLKVNRPTDIGGSRQEWADEAYLLADAMLQAREVQS